MGRLFGTDGVRGVAITELTCELVMNIGRAAASVLLRNDKKTNILVAKDTRVSSDALEAALIAGIVSVGADVELLGVVPTPALAFLIKEFNADGGIMISASHNPFSDNGIKIFSASGEKLPDETEDEIENLIFNEPLKMILKQGAEIGKIRSLYSGKDIYINHLKANSGGDLKGLKLLLDCANGSACSCADVFEELGAECDFIGNNPSGFNINDNCGSTYLGNISEKIKEGNYDAGVAFDGDADRCLFVDENGSEVTGDKIIALLAKSMKEDGNLKNNTAVVTIMSNMGFHEYMRVNGIETISASVGDRYVYEEMKRGNYNIGGENSGHIILSDFATTGDGLLSAARFLSLLKKSGKKFSELVAPIKDYPQKLVNIKVNPDMRANWQKNEKITGIIKEAEEFFAASGQGRVNVRASGTEPLLRVMIEAKNAEDVETWTEKIRKVIENEL